MNETIGDTKGADFKANNEGPAGSIFAGTFEPFSNNAIGFQSKLWLHPGALIARHSNMLTDGQILQAKMLL